MDNQKLLAKIAELGKNSAGDEEAANAVNAEPHATEKMRVDVPTRLAMSVMMSANVWGAVRRATEPGGTDAVRDAAYNVVDCVLHGGENIRTSVNQAYDRVAASLQTLVGAGVMSSQIRSALLALAEKARPWAEVELGRLVTARDVGLARGGAE